MVNKETVKTYANLLGDLTARGANIKAAAAKKADDNSSVVPEKDPADKGKPAAPSYPGTSPTDENLPANSTNSDGTPVYPAPAAKVIDGPEKVAKLTAKAAGLVSKITALRKSAGGTAEQISTQGSLPKTDNKNDQKEANPPKPAPAGGTADPAVKDAGKEKMEKDKTMTTAPMPKEDSKGEMPPETTNKEANADVDLANIDHTFFSKLAQTCLQFEEGRNVMQACLKKAHGAEHAQNLIKTAMFMEQKMQELAELEAAGSTAAEEFWKTASESEKEGLVKLAKTHEVALQSFETALEQEAYLEGAKIAADMADAGMAGEQPPPGVPGMGGEGDSAAPAGAEGGEVSDEDIIQALQMLVQEGKLTEEDAEAILQQLMGGGEGGAGGAGGAPGGAGGPPPPDAAGGAAGGGAPAAGGPPPEPSPEDKAASAQLKTVGQTVDAIFASVAPKAA